MKKQKPSMNRDYLRVFRAFSDGRRLRILEMLSKGEECACVLLEDLNISQPTLSCHMIILCASGLVKARIVGPWKYYSIDTDGCDYAEKLVRALKDEGAAKALKFLRLFAGIPASVTGAAGRLSESDCCVCRPSYVWAQESCA